MALQRSFEKIMRKSSAKCMTIPVRFGRTYAYHLDEYVAMHMAGEHRFWYVKVNLRDANNRPHVSFGAGWNQFMRRYQLVEGHRLRFTLSRPSVFKVTVVRANVGAVRPPTMHQTGRRRF